MHCGPRAGVDQRAEGWEVVQPVPQRAACLPGQRGWTQLGLHDCSLHRCSTGFMFTAEKQQPWLLHIELLTVISVIFFPPLQCLRIKFCATRLLWTPCPPVLPQRITCPWADGLPGKPWGSWSMWSKVSLSHSSAHHLCFFLDCWRGPVVCPQFSP